MTVSSALVLLVFLSPLNFWSSPKDGSFPLAAAKVKDDDFAEFEDDSEFDFGVNDVEEDQDCELDKLSCRTLFPKFDSLFY